MKKKWFLVLIFVVLITFSCKEKSKQSYYRISNIEISEIIDQLLRFKFNKVALLQIETMPVHENTDEHNDSLGTEIPPPPLIINYSESFFYSMTEQNLIDSAEAVFMYNKINPENIISLDKSLIDIACISQNELEAIFNNYGISESYEYIEENYGSSCFIKVSTPIFNENENKVLISIDYYCRPLYGQGYVLLLEKKNNDWRIIKEWGTWES